MAELLTDADHWRRRADEIRRLISNDVDPETRRVLTEIAEGYDLLAVRADQRAEGR
jgi:hypothetical protein